MLPAHMLRQYAAQEDRLKTYIDTLTFLTAQERKEMFETAQQLIWAEITYHINIATSHAIRMVASERTRYSQSQAALKTIELCKYDHEDYNLNEQ